MSYQANERGSLLGFSARENENVFMKVQDGFPVSWSEGNLGENCFKRQLKQGRLLTIKMAYQTRIVGIFMWVLFKMKS